MSRSIFAIAAALLTMNTYGGVVIDVARYGADLHTVESTIRIHAQKGMLRMDQLDEERKQSRLLYTGEQLFDIDVSRGHYAVIDRQRIRAARRTSDPTAALRAELLAEVPPAHLYDVKRLMSGPPEWARESAHIEITNKMRAYTPLNIDCRVYRVQIDGKLTYEYCVTDDLPALKEFIAASKVANALLNDFFEVLEMPWMSELMRVEWTHAYDIPDVPLWVREFEEGKAIREFRVLRVREEKLHDGTFELPAGLRRRAVLDFPFDEEILGGRREMSQ